MKLKHKSELIKLHEKYRRYVDKASDIDNEIAKILTPQIKELCSKKEFDTARSLLNEIPKFESYTRFTIMRFIIQKEKENEK